MITDILNSMFGFDRFRGLQREIIDRILDQQHCLVLMPTGSGKSLCYQIPAIAMRRQADSLRQLTIVISPLIALMKDQVDALSRRGIPASFINSSLTAAERHRRQQEIRDGQFDLLYVTPERFRKSEFMECIASRTVGLLAVDEAHCISSWGHDFRPDYTRLAEFRHQLGQPTTIALTATATPEVQTDIIHQLGLEKEKVHQFHEGIDRPNLELTVKECWGDEEKLEQIVDSMTHLSRMGGSGIIYFTLIKTLERFSELLQARSLDHLTYHGDLDRRSRRRIQSRFMESDALVLATNAFGMGIDKEDIRTVMHAEIPGSIESYYQEIGRAGRDGKPSECVLLYDERDLTTQMEFIRWSNPDAEFYERVYQILRDEQESLRAFGMDWLKERLHRKPRHDHRLETVLAMLDRYNVIQGEFDPWSAEVVSDLPDQLSSEEARSAKLQQDQRRLLALVQYIKCEEDRQSHLRAYFGVMD